MSERPPASAKNTAEPRSARWRRLAGPIAVWTVAAVAFLVLLGAGSVTIYPGGGVSRDASIRRVWDVQSDRLPDLGSNDLTRVLFGASIAVFVFGALVLLWLALTLDPVATRPPTGDHPNRAPGDQPERA